MFLKGDEGPAKQSLPGALWQNAIVPWLPESSVLCIHLAICSELLSLSLPFLSNSGDHVPLACLPLTLPSAPLACLFQKKCLQPAQEPVPQLRLPKPSALLALYSYLSSHRIKIQDIFNKVDQSKNNRISREKFIMALKTVSSSNAPSRLA